MDYTPLATWGIPGFFIFILATVIIYQNRRIEKLYNEKDSLQERRLQNVNETLDKYSATMGEFSETTKLLLAKLTGKRDE